MIPSESQNSRDARIEALWKKLDTQQKGEIDVVGLQRGLKKLDHPLKNAKNLIDEIMRAIDKNGDKIIQYEEFRVFVEQTEKELLSLFDSIDRDQDGRLDKKELQAAFKKAGLAVPNSKLDQFFTEVDENNDGYITFDEWRNFLLFLPATRHTPLKAVLSYYSSTVSINSEGDTSIREDTLEGLGNPQVSYLQLLFGAVMGIAKPIRTTTATTTEPMQDLQQVDRSEVSGDVSPSFAASAQPASAERKPKSSLLTDGNSGKSLLTEVLPSPGYFLAGGAAGVISRTATAPLDRLKVYLIANVKASTATPILAAKKGDIPAAVKHFSEPLVAASKELWKVGGIRSLFAGNGLNVLKVMPESAIKFGSYETAKRALAQYEGHGDPKNIHPFSKFLAGGFGGTVSQLFVYPMDTLKFRMQCETVSGGLRGNKLIVETWKKMLKQGGWRAPYRGLTMGLVGMFPYAAIDLSTFEASKAAYARRNAKRLGCHEEDAQPGSAATAFLGGCSGALGASIMYPVNLLRTRLQAQGTVLHPPTYTGIWDVAQKTVKNEGVRGLFKGLTPNLIKVVPAVSITYVVYENGKKALDLH